MEENNQLRLISFSYRLTTKNLLRKDLKWQERLRNTRNKCNFLRIVSDIFNSTLRMYRLTLALLCKHSVITRECTRALTYLTFAIQRYSFIYTEFARLEMAPFRCKLRFADFASSVPRFQSKIELAWREIVTTRRTWAPSRSNFRKFRSSPTSSPGRVARNGYVTSAAIKTVRVALVRRKYTRISVSDRRYERESRK